MLVLSRKKNEKIKIGDNIVVTVVQLKGNSVRIGVDAPPELKIVRDELRKPSPSPLDDHLPQNRCA